METKSVFKTLNEINCNEHTETKDGLTYLSWAWAWQMVKENFPKATYTIHETEQEIPYFTDGKTCWVKTSVTIEGITHTEYLPIMDYRNASIPLERVTSMDMNKAIQRSLTKCCARHGLGLYIYAGEDLPNVEQEPRKRITTAMLEKGEINQLIDWMAKYQKGTDKYEVAKKQALEGYAWESMALFERFITLADKKNFVNDLNGGE